MPQPLKDAGFTWPVDGQIMHPRYLYAFRINAVLAGNSAFPLDSDILYVEIPDERFEPTPSMLEPGIRCLLYGSRYQIGGEYLVGDDWVKPVMLQGEKDPLYGIYLMQRYQKKTGERLDRYIALPNDTAPDCGSLEAFAQSTGLPAKEAERWYAIIQNCTETMESLFIVTTGDLERVAPFNTNTMHILEGRGIDADDTKAVCVVSAELAQRQGVRVGDKLSMRLRDTQYYYTELLFDGSQQWSIESPADSVEVFAEVEYEVVGIYKSMGWMDYRFAQYFNPGTIFVSAAATPKSGNEEMNSWRTPQVMWGFYLKNPDDADAFLASLPEDLRDFVHIADQGYSHVKPMLAELRSNARTILLITLAVWLAVVGIFLFIHVFRAKHTMGTLRSLGMPARKVFSVFLLACLALWLVSAAVGGIASAFLYEKLEAKAFQNVFESGAYNQAFSDIGAAADQGTNPWTGETDDAADALVQRVYSAGREVPRVLLSLGIQAVLFFGISAAVIWLVSRKKTIRLLKGT